MTKELDSVMSQVEQQLGESDASGVATSVMAKAPSFQQLTPSNSGAAKPLANLFGVRLDVEAVLGRANLTVEDALNLGVGSVVELNRLVSEPVDLIVQNVCVGRGEVVVVNDQFAIRITEITDSKH